MQPSGADNKTTFVVTRLPGAALWLQPWESCQGVEAAEIPLQEMLGLNRHFEDYDTLFLFHPGSCVNMAVF